MDEAAVDKESSHLFKVDLFQSTLMAYQLLRQVGRWVEGAVRRHTSEDWRVTTESAAGGHH